MWCCLFLFIFYFIFYFSFCILFFCFFYISVSICTCRSFSKRPKIFSTGLPFYFYFFLLLLGNVLSGFVIEFAKSTLRKMWREHLDKVEKHSTKRRRQILGNKKDVQGAKVKGKLRKKCFWFQTGFIMTLSSHVPKLHDKLNARHFTQVTVL